MIDFWDNRYSQPTFAYGTKPNAFFKENIDTLTPGRLLLPAEGEGRNAVYAAQRGWTVDAFDFSPSAREKAGQLAREAGVFIQYTTSTIQDFTAPASEYNLIGLIYVHMLPDERRSFHQRLISFLKPSGYVVLEAFHTEQVSRKSGGPQNPAMLYNRTDLVQDFDELSILRVEETAVDLDEGVFHQGPARVIRLIAQKMS